MINTFTDLLGSTDGVVCVGSVSNVSATHSIHYCYNPSNFKTEYVTLVLINNLTQCVESVLPTEIMRGYNYDRYQYFYGRRHVTILSPSDVDIAQVHYSPLARLSKFIKIIQHNSCTGEHLVYLRNRYKDTAFIKLMNMHLINIINNVTFVKPHAEDIEWIKATLVCKYYGPDVGDITIKRDNPRDRYYRILGSFMSKIVMTGYSEPSTRAVIESLSLLDHGHIWNLFFPDGRSVAPYNLIRSYQTPLNEPIRYSRERNRVQLENYNSVSRFLGLIQNPFLE